MTKLIKYMSKISRNVLFLKFPGTSCMGVRDMPLPLHPNADIHYAVSPPLPQWHSCCRIYLPISGNTSVQKNEWDE